MQRIIVHRTTRVLRVACTVQRTAYNIHRAASASARPHGAAAAPLWHYNRRLSQRQRCVRYAAALLTSRSLSAPPCAVCCTLYVVCCMLYALSRPVHVACCAAVARSMEREVRASRSHSIQSARSSTTSRRALGSCRPYAVHCGYTATVLRTARHRTALHCTARHRFARHRTAAALHGAARHCAALHSTARHGTA